MRHSVFIFAVTVTCLLAQIWALTTTTPPTTTTPTSTTDKNFGCYQPASPLNGNTRCQYCDPYCDATTCYMTCNPGYAFADGSTSKSFECNYLMNMWSQRTGSPRNQQVDVCYPSSAPPSTTTPPIITTPTSPTDRNSGCYTPVSPVHGNTRCEPCVPYCDAMTCYLTCEAGYVFVDGTTCKTFVCNWLANMWSRETGSPRDHHVDICYPAYP